MKTIPGAIAGAVLAVVAIAANGQTPATSVGEQSLVPIGSSVTLAGHTPPQVLDGRATRVGHYEPSQMLRLAVVLAVPKPVEEQRFLEDVQNKQSPLFHQFLSPEEWNARFGPSVENEQAVVDWAQGQGLTVTHRYNNRLVVDLEAQAGVIEKALNLTINRYQLPADGRSEARTVYSNDRDPSLPENLRGVVDAVLGLNSIEAARPGSGTGRLAPTPDYAPGPAMGEGDSLQRDALSRDETAIAKVEGNTPDVAKPKSNFHDPTYYWSSKAYDYQALMNQGHCCNPLKSKDNSPRESSIAIAGFGYMNLADVNAFQEVFSYLATNVYTHPVDGGYTCVNTPKGPDDFCFEITMDTEWSLSMANSEGAIADTARLDVYEGSNYTNGIIMDVYNHIVDDDHDRIMSTSFGWEENTEFYNNDGDTYNATMQSVDKVFSSMVGQGWTLVADSGDNGATAGCQDKLAVEFPASDPNVVSVGGTILGEGKSTSPFYEIAWEGFPISGSCLGNNGGSTGGFSEYFPQPGYQSFLSFQKRAVPDMALDANPTHDVYYNGGWIYGGGTSVSTPMMAGFFAQQNAYLLSIGKKCGSKGDSACAPIGNANYPIYWSAQSKVVQHFPFYDIVLNCNANDITAQYPELGYYCAVPGFDEVTGWGSANMLQLAWDINLYFTPSNGYPYITFTGPETHKWYNTNQTVKWTIHDYTGGLPANVGTGIAGETQGWDSIPDDPTLEPHGGTGNSFYDGPQFPNGSTGCLAFEPNGCSGGVSQGCHTAYARGWNNQGWSTSDNPSYPETYGPICYDTVAPTIKVTNNPSAPSASGWYTKPVTVTLKASDPGGSKASGIWKVFYSINDDQCTPATYGDCIEYTSAFTVSTPGIQTITAFSRDNAGNSSSVATDVIKIDAGGPTISIGNSPSLPAGGWYNSPVTVTLSATDPSGIKDIYYSINQPGCSDTNLALCSIYSTPLVFSTQGSETLKAFSRNTIGTYSNVASETINIDTTPPVTTASLSGTEVGSQYQSAVGVVLSATDNLSGVKGTYYSIDGGAAITYAGPFNISLAGSHTLSYWSVDVAGNTETANVQTLVLDSATTALLTASPNPSVAGQSVTLTATVTAALTGTPTGTVSFYNGTTLLGTGTLNSSGIATYTTAALPLGANSLQATYPGATYYLASSPANFTQTVEQLPTATATAPALTFNPAAIGISAASAQTLTASFTVTNFTGSFTPTAALHYGHDYTLGAVNCTGGGGKETCTVPVTFQPTLPGARKDAVQLMAGSTVLATQLLGGTGQGPMALMQPGVVTSYKADYYIYQSVVDENGTVYYMSDNTNAVYSLAKGSSTPALLPITGLNGLQNIDIDGAGTLYITSGGLGTSILTYNTVTGVQGTVTVLPPAPYKPCAGSTEYLNGVTVDDAGNLFVIEQECKQIFELTASGSYATTAVNPTMIGPNYLAVDAADDVFAGGYDINELTAGGAQTQINTVGAATGLEVDAAGTLYATRYTGSGGVVELLASDYSTLAFALDPAAAPIGEGLGSDGTLYVGDYSNLDKVDRSQGLIAFGEQNAGVQSPVQNAILYNGGNESLTLASIAISGAPFNLLPGATNNCTAGLVIAAGAWCEVGVSVTPQHAGTYSGTVTFTSNSLNAAGTVQTVALTAFVYGVYMVPSPTALTFPNQAKGTTSTASMVMLTNEGDLYAGIIGVPTSSNPAFTPTLGTCTNDVDVGSSCELNVTFSPSEAQSYSGTITVPASSGGGGITPSATFTVSGMGVTAAPSASPAPSSSRPK